MKLSKKVVSLICLSFVMLMFSSSSRNNIVNKSNLSSIKDINENIDTIEQYSIIKSSNNEENKEPTQEELEKERQLKVGYSKSDMTLASGITKEELKAVLMTYKGASTMAHLSDALVDAEQTYNVNAFTMAAIVALESGFATSRRAVEDNNLTGYEVYSDDSEGKLFPSQDDSILQTARHLSVNYLTEGGTYYKGLSVDDVQLSYCPDEGKGKNWNGKVDMLASGFLKIYKGLYLNNTF